MTVSDILTGLAFVAIFEGLVLALAPGRIGDILQVINRMQPDTLRIIGLSAVAFGVVVLYVLR